MFVPGPNPEMGMSQVFHLMKHPGREPAAAAGAHLEKPDRARACLGKQLELGTAHLTHVSGFLCLSSLFSHQRLIISHSRGEIWQHVARLNQ